jgi:hypothetical protein
MPITYAITFADSKGEPKIRRFYNLVAAESRLEAIKRGIKNGSILWAVDWNNKEYDKLSEQENLPKT